MYRTAMSMNPLKGDREDEKRMLPCRYFVAGFCQKGSRCKFFHPNMHGRDPIIRVPDLPSDFKSIPQYASYEQSQSMPSLFPSLGNESRGLRSRRMKTGFSSPITTSSPRRIGREGYRGYLSPSSHAYSEYMTYAHQNREDFLMDEEMMDDYGESSDEGKPCAVEQNTVFSHIDWSEFLTPGLRPPPPTNVPDQTAAVISPMRLARGINGDRAHGSGIPSASLKSLLGMTNQDMPPEGYQGQGDSDTSASPTKRKLSAKQELQMKVKQIAKELADEPVPHVRSLDSFFRSVKFNGASTNHITASTSSPASTACLLVDAKPVEEEKENEINHGKENASEEKGAVIIAS